MQNLHLANNNNLDASDKFAKVKMLITILKEAYIINYWLEHIVIVNKSIIPYFGRHGAMQFILNKSIRVAAACKEYCIKFNSYLGAGKDKTNPELDLGGSVLAN